MASSRTDEESQREKKNSFPKAFYDPNTHKLFEHPVVGPDGISVEKQEDHDPSVYYPNRALEDLMEEQLEKAAMEGSIRGTLLQWQASLRSVRLQLLEKTAIPSREYQPLPEALYCPISFELMHQPVIGSDGTTYEKAAILHWLGNNSVSPISRSPLKAEQLYKNLAIQEIIEDLTEGENETHQSIRNWKEVHSARLKQSAAEELALNNAQEEGGQQQSRPDPPGGRPTPQYATTPEELERIRRRRQRRMQLNGIAIVLSIFVLVIGLVLGLGEIIFYFMLIIWCCVPDRKLSEEERRHAQREAFNNAGGRGRVR